MKIDVKEVEYVATLARLRITEEEKEIYTGQIARILEYMDKLKEVDTEGVEPTFHAVKLETPFRQDQPGDSLDSEEALANAPDKDASSFVVPKVI